MGEVVAVFSVDQVCDLTGVTRRQLAYWDQTGFFTPEPIDGLRRPFNRVYSLRDVVGLGTIGMLRNTYRIPLAELRRVGKWLHRHHGSPWSSLRFYVANRRVYFSEPRSRVRMEAAPRSGQAVLLDIIEMEAVASRIGRAVADRQRRHRDQVGRLSQNRYVAHNATVVAGTRIPTSAIWQFHQAGYSAEQIILEYPRLKPADIAAAIRHERERHAQRLAS